MCYECKDRNTTSCRNGSVNNWTKKQCGPLNICGVEYLRQGSSYIYARGCSVQSLCYVGCSKHYRNDKEVCSYCCERDLCNGNYGEQMTGNYYLLMLLISMYCTFIM
ncbi:uncharacterized protein LOC144353880 [Saccoglossus kowalevskii]